MNLDSKISAYSSQVPEEIQLTLKALANEYRLGLLVAFLKHGKMSFTEIKNKLKTDSSSLSRHLSILEDANMVNNILSKRKSRISSNYEATEITEEIFESIFNTILGKPNNHNEDGVSREMKDEELEKTEIMSELLKLVDKVNSSNQKISLRPLK